MNPEQKEAVGGRKYPRAAHASIRGYLYQACVGVEAWLGLSEGEALLCEGDDDLDQILTAEPGQETTSIHTQVKDYVGKLNLRDQAVGESLRNFLTAYARLRRDREDQPKFRFLTTAEKRLQRPGSFDPLEHWHDEDQRPTVIDAVRERALEVTKEKPKALKELEEALTWMDGAEDRWPAFLGSVQWHFQAPNLRTKRAELESHPKLAGAESPDLVLDRLLWAVLEASSEADPLDRLLTPGDLQGVLAATEPRTEVVYLRKAFDEALELEKLLSPKRERFEEHDRLALKGLPSLLLTAQHEVIAFDEQNRGALLRQLAEWCGEDRPVAVRLLYGPGGAGKTRLMIEWCRRLESQGWFAGFVNRALSDEQADQLVTGMRDRLLVIDYAESQLQQKVEPLLKAVVRRPSGTGPRVRIALLSRTNGDWWQGLAGGDPMREKLLYGAPEKEVPPMVPAPEDRPVAFQAAVEVFRGLMEIEEAGETEAPDLSLPLFERGLYLHMAALAATRGRRIEEEEELLSKILGWERRVWRLEVEDVPNLDGSLQATLVEAFGQAVAGFTLIEGAADRASAMDVLLRSCPDLDTSRPELPKTLLKLLRRLYGGFDRYLGGLQPDLLGERLVEEQLEQGPQLLDRVFDDGSLEQAKAALTVLTRLARRSEDTGRGQADRWLRAALRDRIERLGLEAVEVALETGDLLGLVLAKLVRGEATMSVCQRLMKRIDQIPHPFALSVLEVAAEVTSVCFSTYKEQWSKPGPSELRELGRLATNLAARQAQLGRRKAALVAALEAVDLRRRLVSLDSGESRPWLADSLGNLGDALRNLGRHKEAFSAMEEAIEIHRLLASEQPRRYQPALARSLTNYGIVLGEIGRYEDALCVSVESVEIRRRLAEADPSHRPGLATSWLNLGAIYDEMGNGQAALDAVGESVEIFRSLAEVHPGAFEQSLGRALSNLTGALSRLLRFDEALAPIEESTEIFRKLAFYRPGAFLPELALSLTNLGHVQGKLGMQEAAMASAEEAVTTLQPFFLAEPAGFAAWMTILIRNYREICEAVGSDPKEAVLAPIEAKLAELNEASTSEEAEEAGSPRSRG